ncbi:MAG: hypothetical protein GY756_23000 [bacterium]|nr:hypothetical protein [bacterium]
MKYVQPKLNIINTLSSTYCATGTSAIGTGHDFFWCLGGRDVTGTGECTDGGIANERYKQCKTGAIYINGACSGGGDARDNCSSGSKV